MSGPYRKPEPTWLGDKIRQYTSLEPQPDESLGDTATQLGAGFIPGVGQAMALRDMTRAYKDNDYLGMGLSAASLIPGAHLVKALKKGSAPIQELIAGRQALKAPHAKLDAAEGFAKAGDSPQTQWDKVQAYKGPDHQPKWEIEDKFSEVHNTELPFAQRKKLVDVLHHPELYDNYPQLKDTHVYGTSNIADYERAGAQFVPDAYGPGKHAIEVNARTPEEFHKFLLHETQHGIQNIEPGFSKGSSPESAYKRLLNDKLDAIGVMPDTREISKLKEQSMPAYLRNMGETESRAVEKRMYGDKRYQVPTGNYDVPIDDLWR